MFIHLGYTYISSCLHIQNLLPPLLPAFLGFAKDGAMPKLCRGYSERVPCIFSPSKIGKPARPHQGDKCLFCDVEKMKTACETTKGKANVARCLKAFRAHYETHNYVYNSALMRVPDERREKFHEEALKSKRGPPQQRRQRRNATAVAQADTVAAQWTAALQHRKRAFKELEQEEVTAYKKRRTADRTRVTKKFFLDNQLQQPEAKDIAENDAGLPAASSTDRAPFVEGYCKFGSWGICRDCHSLQPRPLEPLDTRRVAQAEITAKACKQCRSKKWVPQPSDIPRPLRKLSLKMVRKLRPLEIDVGPIKKANNGYRMHSAMTRLSWGKLLVKDKIAKARATRIAWGFLFFI